MKTDLAFRKRKGTRFFSTIQLLRTSILREMVAERPQYENPESRFSRYNGFLKGAAAVYEVHEVYFVTHFEKKLREVHEVYFVHLRPVKTTVCMTSCFVYEVHDI